MRSVIIGLLLECGAACADAPGRFSPSVDVVLDGNSAVDELVARLAREPMARTPSPAVDSSLVAARDSIVAQCSAAAAATRRDQLAEHARLKRPRKR